jgi:hypothetical protein
MEESMHGSLEKPGKVERNIYGSWGVRLFAIPVLLLTALIGFVLSHPAESSWISQAMQAQFAGSDRAAATKQTAKPAIEFRTVKAH